MKKTTIKKITLSLLLIIITGGFAIGLSKAVFQDQEVINQTVSMGVLNLQVGDVDPVNVSMDFSNMVPNETRSYTYDVKNTGQIQGNFWLEVLINSESEGISPENEAITEYDGDISHCARLSLSMSDVADDDILLIDNELIVSIDQQNFDTNYESAIDQMVNMDKSRMIVTLNTIECGSETIGDILQMDLAFYLTQVTN